MQERRALLISLWFFYYWGHISHSQVMQITWFLVIMVIVTLFAWLFINLKSDIVSILFLSQMSVTVGVLFLTVFLQGWRNV